MSKPSIIYKNFLEEFVMDLKNNKRKTCIEIAEIIRQEKKIPISNEAVRKFFRKKNLHENT